MSTVLIQPSAAAGFVSLFGQISKGSGDTVNIPEGMINIGGNGRGFLISPKTNWNPKSNGVSSLSLGDDIYLYAVEPNDGGYADVVASKNSTVPSGYTASNSRKIGGFHYGRVRPISKRYDTSFNPPTQIVPNSCWDLQHRPKCDPSGMVEVIPGALWTDIYLASEGAGSWPQTMPVSRCGATPLSGTEGYSRYPEYPVLLANAGKRFPHVHEFSVYADGAPQGNDNDNDLAWSDTSNPGRKETGHVAKAISTANVVDTTGNLWEPCVDTYDDTGTREWDTDILDNGKDRSEGRGAVYHSRWRFVVAGGRWGDGAHTGARCLSTSHSPENANSGTGLRGVCDAL